uniref:Uncharacterized protein n=1 Tax=Macrostomum lignano TaxID=282301 RepID=A0A1I8GCA8_9PLAT
MPPPSDAVLAICEEVFADAGISMPNLASLRERLSTDADLGTTFLHDLPTLIVADGVQRDIHCRLPNSRATSTDDYALQLLERQEALLQAELLKGPFDNKEAASRAMQCCQLPDETYCIDLDCDSCSVLHRKMAVVEEQMDRLKNELQSAKAAASERHDLLLKEVDAHKSTQRRLEVANAEMDDLRQEIDRLRTTGESSEFQSNVIRIMQDFAAQSLATSQTPASVAPAIHASPSIEVISEILGEDQRVPLLASAPNVTITREQKAAIEHAVAELRREPGDKQLRKLTRLLIRSLFSTSELCVTTVSGMAKKQQIRMPANCHICAKKRRDRSVLLNRDECAKKRRDRSVLLNRDECAKKRRDRSVLLNRDECAKKRRDRSVLLNRDECAKKRRDR